MNDITRKQFLAGVAGGLAAAGLGRSAPAGMPGAHPNIVLIVADDLGYGELGCYGQADILTPRLDQMAAEGMRFTHCYAGSTICAPSRATLMTGFHTGNAPIRDNGLGSLEPGDVTIAEILRQAGYRNYGIGKWGLGDSWSSGAPWKKGFDLWYGYLNHLHAHNYYPTHLWLNELRVPILGNHRPVRLRGAYSHDLFTDAALHIVESEHAEPFFLYLPYTIPHANTFGPVFGLPGIPVPSDEPYTDKKWPQNQKNHAAMITRLDRDVGRILDALEAKGIAGNTLVIFTSDNGPHREGGADPEFFKSAGPFRGIKRSLHEGGIRVPMLAWWPGVVPAGAVSDHPCAFWDFLPTLTEAAGTPYTGRTDGISFLPELLGHSDRQPTHEYLYWEYSELGFQQALRHGDWKLLRNPLRSELYNIANDPGESNDLLLRHPALAAELFTILDEVRSEPDDGRGPGPWRRRWRDWVLRGRS